MVKHCACSRVLCFSSPGVVVLIFLYFKSPGLLLRSLQIAETSRGQRVSKLARAARIRTNAIPNRRCHTAWVRSKIATIEIRNAEPPMAAKSGKAISKTLRRPQPQVTGVCPKCQLKAGFD